MLVFAKCWRRGGRAAHFRSLAPNCGPAIALTSPGALGPSGDHLDAQLQETLTPAHITSFLEWRCGLPFEHLVLSTPNFSAPVRPHTNGQRNSPFAARPSDVPVEDRVPTNPLFSQVQLSTQNLWLALLCLGHPPVCQGHPLLSHMCPV